MIWLASVIFFAIGMCIGAILFKQLKSDTVKIIELEDKLEALQIEHDEYKQNVLSHFTASAQLFHNLTDSYRSVYNHLASGAQTLCPDNVPEQLSLVTDNKEILGEPDSTTPPPDTSEFDPSPPRDYAAKTDPDGKGSLSEDFGLHPSDEDKKA